MNIGANISRLGLRQRKALELKAKMERATKPPDAGSLQRKAEQMKAELQGTAQQATTQEASQELGGALSNSPGPALPNLPGGDSLDSLAGNADVSNLGQRQLKAAALKADVESKLRQQAAEAVGGELIRFEDAASLQSLLGERELSLDAVWSHEQNADLRALRGSPDELQPGDQVFVPKESQKESGGPVGQGDYIVKQGDCTNSIAKDKGHFWETIWNDPANTELRDVRKNPNVLLPEDRVTIPPLTPKQEPGEAEKRHRFVRRGEPAMLRTRILKREPATLRWERIWGGENGELDTVALEDEARRHIGRTNEGWTQVPRGNEPYTLEIDGYKFEGTTSPNGEIEVPIVGNDRRARLVVGEGQNTDEYLLRLGNLDPIETVTGAQQRLNNLGYGCGKVDGIIGPKTRSALHRIQRDHKLTPTQRPDKETRQKLIERHGC